ncbi:MAG: hypothetical protein JOY54_04765 [Acidobacteriaceae bacterium]|nr:hypothetical protein [Acidobacteriaceae bacterium]
MSAINSSISPIRHLAYIIRAELAVYPGRVSLVTRIVLACASVMVAVNVFRIPGAAIGAYYPLLLSRDNPQVTRDSALRIAFACILGAAEVIVGGVLSAGSPFLHFIWVAGTLFVVFYLISSLKFLDAATAMAVLIGIEIGLWDEPMSAEMRVTQTLYTLLSILIACGLSVVIEILFAKKPSLDAVLDGLRQRLALVEDLLENHASLGRRPSPLGIQLSRYAAKGVGDLQDQLANSNYESTYKEQLATVLALSGQLVELAANLAESRVTLSSDDINRCFTIAHNIATIRTCLLCEEAPEWLDLPEDSAAAGSPILIEIERTVDLIAQSFADENLPFIIISQAPLRRKGQASSSAMLSEATNTSGSRYAAP